MISRHAALSVSALFQPGHLPVHEPVIYPGQVIEAQQAILHGASLNASHILTDGVLVDGLADGFHLIVKPGVAGIIPRVKKHFVHLHQAPSPVIGFALRDIVEAQDIGVHSINLGVVNLLMSH